MVISRAQKIARLRFSLLNEARGMQRESLHRGQIVSKEELSRKLGVIREQKALAQKESGIPPTIFDAEYRTHYRILQRDFQNALSVAQPFVNSVLFAKDYSEHKSALSKMGLALEREFGQSKGRQLYRFIRQEYPELRRRSSSTSLHFKDAEEALDYFRSQKRFAISIMRDNHIAHRNWENLFDDITADVVNRLMHYDGSRGLTLKKFLKISIGNALADYIREMGDYSRGEQLAFKKGKIASVSIREFHPELNQVDIDKADLTRISRLIDERGASRRSIRLDRDEIMTALKFIPEFERKLIILRYGYDLPLTEVASRLGYSKSSESYIKRKIDSGLVLLRRWYASHRG